MTARLARWLTVLLLAGCGSTNRAPTNAGGNEAGVTDAAGVYHQSVYTCCGPGDGLSCCAAAPGLLGYATQPDGGIAAVGSLAAGPEANCFQFGGPRGACVSSGEQFDAKEICAVCCPGLTRVHGAVAATSDGDAGCLSSGPPSVFTCLPCGNGTCEPAENRCSCPADCD